MNQMSFAKLQTCFSTCYKSPSSQLLGSVPGNHTSPGLREKNNEVNI